MVGCQVIWLLYFDFLLQVIDCYALFPILKLLEHICYKSVFWWIIRNFLLHTKFPQFCRCSLLLKSEMSMLHAIGVTSCRSPAGHMAIREGMEVSGLPAVPFLLERIDEEMPRTMARKLYFASRSRERWMATIFKFAVFSWIFLVGIPLQWARKEPPVNLLFISFFISINTRAGVSDSFGCCWQQRGGSYWVM